MLYLPKFDYFEPKTVSEACSLLSEFGEETRVLAGGTDLLVQMKEKAIKVRYLINLKYIPELKKIKRDEDSKVQVGSVVTLTSIIRSPIIRKEFEILAEAARSIGTIQIQNLATIGGNLCNASPSADLPPVLMALGAKVRLVSLRREREVMVEELFRGPFKTILEPDEILTQIDLPNPLPITGGAYIKFTKITAIDESLVAVGIVLNIDENKTCLQARIGLASVAPTPIRAYRAEEYLRGKKLSEKVTQEVAQIVAGETNPRSRANYRREMTKLVVKRGLMQALEKIRS